MVNGRGIALATLFGLCLVACAQIIGLSKLQEGEGPSNDAGDGSTATDGGVEGGDASQSDHCANGTKDVDETDEDCGGATCGKCAKGKGCKVDGDCASKCVGGVCFGCAGVEVDGGSGRCIDATEVTVGEYESYAAEARVFRRGAPAFCSGAVAHPRNFASQLANRGLPVRFVKWCTAWAFCDFRGRHLCTSDRGEGEWLAACRGSGGLAYPYGNSFEDARCNDVGATSPWDAGSGTNCKTLDPLNVYDMSGNVAEWADGCADAGRGSCAVRGGAYGSSADEVRCDSTELLDIDTERADLGFRCCE